jgi:hypothetical protein
LGGAGSGNRRRWNSKSTCELSNRIDLRHMRRHGLLAPGRSGTLGWSIRGEPSGMINYRIFEVGIELDYQWRQGEVDEWHPVITWVPFTFTAQKLGGERRWFLCPNCSRRCAILYGGVYFRCRQCHDLAYQSQHEAPHWRSLSQAQKLRQRLGGSGSMGEPFPERPKGKHRKTYERICCKAAQLEGRMARLEPASGPTSVIVDCRTQ